MNVWQISQTIKVAAIFTRCLTSPQTKVIWSNNSKHLTNLSRASASLSFQSGATQSPHADFSEMSTQVNLNVVRGKLLTESRREGRLNCYASLCYSKRRSSLQANLCENKNGIHLTLIINLSPFISL